MSGDVSDNPLDDEAVERAIRRLSPTVQLDREELEIIREVIQEWVYQRRKREDRKRNWPLIALVASFLTTAAGWGINLFMSKGHGP